MVSIGLLLLLVFSSCASLVGGTQEQAQPIKEIGSFNTRDSVPYEGRVRIYITEPVSRWNNYDHDPYHFGCLGIPLNQQLSLDTLESYDNTFVWNGDVSEQNVLVMAAVFSPDWYQGYANQPNNPFDAHYVDAAAASFPGETTYNFENATITHTVFVEEGTATWCPYCPAMAEALYTVYESGEYPFYFIALVDDKNSQAADRLRNDYNIYGFPTAFFDGGKSVIVGGDGTPSHYSSRIKTCGQRPTYDVNLSLSVEYIGNGDLQIHVTVTNYDELHAPVTPSTPVGPSQGNVGIRYQFNTTTTDGDGGDLFYLFDWGDGTDSGWAGPFQSGAQAFAQHIWTKEGSYQVKVMAKDRANHQTEWTTTVPVEINPPVFVFSFVTQPFKINATITNNGIATFPEVIWAFHLRGGLLNLIDVSKNSTSKNFAPGDSIKIHPSDSIFGLGKLTLTMTATVAEQTTFFEAKGFIFGPFMKLTVVE